MCTHGQMRLPRLSHATRKVGSDNRHTGETPAVTVRVETAENDDSVDFDPRIPLWLFTLNKSIKHSATGDRIRVRTSQQSVLLLKNDALAPGRRAISTQENTEIRIHESVRMSKKPFVFL